MKQGIIIGSSEARKDTWLPELLKSLEGCKYPYKVFYSDNFELSVIEAALRETDFEELFFIPDSTIIKKLELFDLMFGNYAGKSVSICQHPNVGGMYLMKYLRNILNTMPIPKVPNKKMAVYWEVVFNLYYAGLDGDVEVLFPEMYHSNVFVTKHGRVNMVMGNEYIDRYKGNWGNQPL